MMNSCKLKLFVFAIMAGMLFSGAVDSDAQNPQSDRSKAEVTSLTNILKNRKTTRTFMNTAISEKTVLDLLWAANGVNRPDGKRTAPSAINSQDIEMFVYIKGNGTFHYNAAENKLDKVNDTDFRASLGMKRPAYEAPVTILLMSNKATFKGNQGADRLGAMDAGYVSQNIYLFCAAAGLGTVACAPPMDAASAQKALGLGTDYIPLILHPVGYPREPAK